MDPVSTDCMDNFPSILFVWSPFVPRSIMNPRILPLSYSDLAQIINISAIDALDIHVLEPFIRYPSAVLIAVVLIPAGSEPASGSGKPKQPISSPDPNFLR